MADNPCPFGCDHDGDCPTPASPDAVEGTPRQFRRLSDLPIYGAFWTADGRDLNA